MKKYIKPESIVVNVSVDANLADSKDIGSYVGDTEGAVTMGASVIKQGWNDSQGDGNAMGKEITEDGSLLLDYDDSWVLDW